MRFSLSVLCILILLDTRKKFDLVFALDGSKGVQAKSFAEMKRFLAGTLGAYQIASENTRVGLMTFGGTTVSNLGLSNGFHKSVVEQGIFDMSLVGGSRNLSDAIVFADKNMFGENRVDGATKVLIFVIAGPSPEGFPSSAATDSLGALRKRNVTILVVTVGKEAVDEELKSLAKEDRFIRVPRIGDLRQALPKIVEESNRATSKHRSFCA